MKTWTVSHFFSKPVKLQNHFFLFPLYYKQANKQTKKKKQNKYADKQQTICYFEQFSSGITDKKLGSKKNSRGA